LEQRTLFFVCAGNELFFVSLYLMKWTSNPIDANLYGSLTYPEVMAFVTGPIFLLKNIINVVQLWKASKILVGVDLAERAEARIASRLEVEEKQKS
jgi:CDP-diacylglycerol--inositol 3-phosphatidyltransferase